LTESMKPSEASGVCQGLSSEDVASVGLFMAAAIRAFELADPAIIEALFHPGFPPRSRQSAFDFNKLLMTGGDKVRSWSARPYTEPAWGVMRRNRHHPPPTIWIDVTLNDGKRDSSYYFACAPDEEGALRSCYYVLR
jgi:hypothetical protein